MAQSPAEDSATARVAARPAAAQIMLPRTAAVMSARTTSGLALVPGAADDATTGVEALKPGPEACAAGAWDAETWGLGA